MASTRRFPPLEENAMHAVNRLISTLAIALAGLSGLSLEGAAQTWPQRTVRVIVPLPPGTSIDVSARLVAEHLSSRWKQPVVVENIAGADGILAVKEFASRRDDHTLLYSFAGPITINPVLYEALPYDPAHDMVPIATTSDNFLVVATSARLKLSSLADLLRHARSNAASFNWAATSGIPYFAFAGFLKSSGVEMTYVPYRDFNPALSDLDEGRIQVASTGLTQVLPHAQAGRATFLALLNRTRTPLAPEVPTAAEAGYPDLAFDGVTGFFGWRDIPSGLRDRIAADVRAAVENPSVRDRLPPLGIVARTSTPAEFVAAIEEQRAKIATIAAAIGTKPVQ
jgi:tripartite-type tricarboxylate transporter receptor subunit TctC